jgi:hypothetical protein
MSTTNDFDALKRKIYLAYHQDGILDITAATVLLGFGTFMATNNVIFLILGAVFAAQYVLMKQRITIPRFGYVRLEPQEKTLTKGWLLAGIGVLLLLVFIVLNTILGNISSSLDMQTWMRRYHMILYSGALFGLPALIVAAFLGLKRFYLYALLTVGLPALGAWLNIDTFIPILVTGFVLLAFGIVLLSSFLKKYPVNDNESSSVNG